MNMYIEFSQQQETGNRRYKNRRRDEQTWLRLSLLRQLDLFVFGRRPLQTYGVHCGGEIKTKY